MVVLWHYDQYHEFANDAQKYNLDGLGYYLLVYALRFGDIMADAKTFKVRNGLTSMIQIILVLLWLYC